MFVFYYLMSCLLVVAVQCEYQEVVFIQVDNSSNSNNKSIALNNPGSQVIRFRVFTANNQSKTFSLHPSMFLTPTRSINKTLASICDPKRQYQVVLIVHGFAETWNMEYRWNWVDDMKRELFKSSEAERLCVVAFDWEELARGGSLLANYWKAIDNMQLAGQLGAGFLAQSGVRENNVHCIGFSLGAHMCSILYKIYFNKYGRKLSRITGLDPAGPFFADKPPSEKLHYSDAAHLVDVIHTSQKFGIVQKNGHIDFFPDDGPSHIHGCGKYNDRFDNAILYEEKVDEENAGNATEAANNTIYENIFLNDKDIKGGLAYVTYLNLKATITSKLHSFVKKVKSLFHKLPAKRVFSKMHQFIGCSHLMAVRFFIHSINDCVFRASYCADVEHYRKNMCYYNVSNSTSGDSFPRMGYHANKSGLVYREKFGNLFLVTTNKAPYCVDTVIPVKKAINVTLL